VFVLGGELMIGSSFVQTSRHWFERPLLCWSIYGDFWGWHWNSLAPAPIFKKDETSASVFGETAIEKSGLPPPPPNPTQDAQQNSIMETQQDFKELSEPCKIAPQKISFNPVVFKKIKRKLNRFIGNILARTEVYKNVVAKYDDLTGKYDDLTGKYDDLTGKYDDLNKNIAEKYDDLMGKYESLLAKETNIKETFWESRADNEKEALFLEHFYLTSVYVASTAGYYLTPKGAKTFIEATEHFKIIEPVDMFMNNPTYHDVANLTYLPCPVSLNKHAFNSTIQNAKKPDISLKPPRKSYFDNLFYHKFNAKKCLKAFHKYSKQYAPLKTPKEV
ncbi:glycosyltransferase family 25 protein, partial [Helicobacter pylori]|uniref:glycosyltransferase family 25 protein n=1 Tax=Helicobacter pylori TaxID=210 RepID=UPI0013CE23D0